MAIVKINLQSGESHEVKHQFGTVRRQLNAAALREKDEKTGEAKAFAEFHTVAGKRVGVNPAQVVDYVELKDED